MSNIVPFDTQVPAHLAGRVGSGVSVLADSLSGGLAAESPPRISIKSSRFRIIEDGVEAVIDATSLEVAIVGANPGVSKMWYSAAWTPDSEATAPDCFSLDGLKPDSSCTSPQNALCADCPQNAWGSRVTTQGTKVKACADQKRLAVVAADDPTGTVYLLQVTPAALKGLHSYHKTLAMRSIPLEAVKTILSFDTNASFPKLQFTFGGYHTAEVQAELDKRFGTPEVLEITGQASVAPPPPSPMTEEPTAVTKKFGAAAKTETATAAPAPAPVTEEPTAVTKKFGAAAKTETATAAPAPAPVTEEPTAAPVIEAGTAALADEIAALMEEVADDA